MSFMDNAFAILGASPRDGRQRLLELADHATLALDQATVSRARAVLSNPRHRVAAEVGWMPGLGPSRAAEAMKQLAADSPEVVLDGLPPLAALNLSEAALKRRPLGVGGARSAEELLAVARYAEAIDSGSVLKEINEDRQLAGWPLIESEEVLRRELEHRLDEVRASLAARLRRFAPEALAGILALALEHATDNGASHGPSLLHDVVDTIEPDLRPLLDRLAEQISRHVEAIKASAEAGASESQLEAACEELAALVEAWDAVAQPLQLSAQARGSEHVESRELAIRLRALAVDLHNDRGLTQLARRLTGHLGEVFAELPIVAERLSEEHDALTELVAEKESDRAAFEAKYAFEAPIGLLDRRRVRISADGIALDQRFLAFDEITKLRWGATRHSVNGIPTGTDHSISAASSTMAISFNTRRGEVFERVVAGLWHGALVRLAQELWSQVARGGVIEIATLPIQSGGIWLTKSRIFRQPELKFFALNDCLWAAQNGSLIIRSQHEPSYQSVLAYQHVDNVHVLQLLLDVWAKRGFGAR